VKPINGLKKQVHCLLALKVNRLRWHWNVVSIKSTVGSLCFL